MFRDPDRQGPAPITKGLGGHHWRERLQTGEAAGAELDLLYALAEYHGDADLTEFAAMGLAAAA